MSLEEERKQAQEALEQEAVEEAQPSAEPSELEAQPQPKEGIRSAAQPPETRLVSIPQGAFAITQLRAYQPGDAVEPSGIARPGQSFSGFISSAELLTFVVDYEIAEPPATELVQQGVAHQVQLYTRDLTTGSKNNLGNTEVNTFVEGRSSYSGSLADVALESGVYKLSAVLTTIQNGRPMATHMMVVQLQVA